MSASLHLVRFRARDVPGGVRRMHRATKHAPGLVTRRLCMAAILDTTFGGTPTPTRYAMLCGWRDDEARDAFRVEAFTAGAREAWSVALEPVRLLQGGLGEWNPSTDGVRKLDRGEPLAVVTWGRLRPRYVPVFTRDNRRIVREMTGGPGLQMMVGMADHPMTRATFSLWRSQGDVVRFAYAQNTIHAPVQRTALDAPWANDWFFARFRPVASVGTWGGVDPMSSVAAAAAA